MNIKVTDFSGGLNKFISRTNLKDNQFHSINDFVIDKTLGKIVRRDGFINFQTDPTYVFRKIINYIDSDDVENYSFLQEATIGWRFYKIYPATAGVFISDTGIAKGDFHPEYLIYNDILRIYLGDIGGTNPFFTSIWYGQIDRDYFNAAKSFDNYYATVTHLLNDAYNVDYDTNTSRNSDMMIAVAGGAGSGIDGGVWRITYTYDDFQESAFVRVKGDEHSDRPIMYCGLTDDDSSHTIGVTIKADTWEDTIAQSSRYKFNKRITGVNLYRTKDIHDDGTGNMVADDDATFYFIMSYDTTGTVWDATYKHNFVDDVLDLAELEAQPSYDERVGHDSECDMLDIQNAVLHKNRIFAGKIYKRTLVGTTGDKFADRLYYSSLQTVGDDSFYSLDSFGNLNFIPVGKGDGDIMTGIVEWGDRLWVYKKYRKYRVSIYTNIALSTVEETYAHGCYAARTLKKTRHGIFAMTKESVYLFNGVTDVEVGLPIRNILSDYSDAQLSSAFATFDSIRDWYWLFIDNDDYTDCYILSMKVSPPSWVKFNLGNDNDWSIKDVHFLDENGIDILVSYGILNYIDRYSDTVYKDYNSIEIESILEGKFYIGDNSKDLLFKNVAIRYNGEAFKLYFYKNDTLIEDIVGTTDYVTFAELTSEASVIKNLSPKIQGNCITYKIVSETDDTNLEIDDIDFEVETVERRL